ncbi:MAG: septal ring lytic transglycosylase RlpA family protein [Sphingopyxis sp.]|nr:septal ring lytic transglycosylase RlpA family protein [Sphingopyxis sp.]
MRVFSALLIPMLLTVSAAAQDMDVSDEAAIEAPDFTEIDGGMASYYGDELAGNRTANGERFDPDQMTGAHRTLPFGSMVRVTNVSNGDSVVIRINDRGPFSRGRVIDISHAAAREIGMHRSGTARVKLALLNDD